MSRNEEAEPLLSGGGGGVFFFSVSSIVSNR